MASGDTKTQQYLDAAANGTRADLPSETCCETRTQTLIRGVAERIMDVEDEVERLENNPDVVDIVATYADLQAYDTQGLTDKDVIRVLQDETHDGDSTYYRYNKQADTWTYIGESKQYTDFVGTDGTTAGEAGLVPAPATTDAGKFLKADGTWDEVQAGPTVVQTIGTSTTDVMSQYATTNMIYPNSAVTTSGIRIGLENPQATAPRSIAIGNDSRANYQDSVALGYYARISHDNSVALGPGAITTASGQLSVEKVASTYGYNNTIYSLISGVYDPQSAHDAATKGYVDTAVASAGADTISSQDWSNLWQ